MENCLQANCMKHKSRAAVAVFLMLTISVNFKFFSVLLNDGIGLVGSSWKSVYKVQHKYKTVPNCLQIVILGFLFAGKFPKQTAKMGKEQKEQIYRIATKKDFAADYCW